MRIIFVLLISSCLLACSDKAQTGDIKSPVEGTQKGAQQVPAALATGKYPNIYIERERKPFDLDGIVHQLREVQRLCLYTKAVNDTHNPNHPPIPDSQLDSEELFRKGFISKIEEVFSGQNYARYETGGRLKLVNAAVGAVDTPVKGQCPRYKVEAVRSAEIISGCTIQRISYGENASIEKSTDMEKPACAKAAGDTLAEEKTLAKPQGEIVLGAGGHNCILQPDSIGDSARLTPEQMKQLMNKAMTGDKQATEELKNKSSQFANQIKAEAGSTGGRECLLESYPYYQPGGNRKVMVSRIAGEKMKKNVQETALQKEKFIRDNIYSGARDFASVEEAKVVEVGKPIPPGKLEFPEDTKGFNVKDNTAGGLK